MKHIISYDLGTGGTKASLFDENGRSLASAFVPCDTTYPQSGFHEQRPDDWWESVKTSTREMLAKTEIDVESIVALAVSGHSLGVVPIGRNGELLAESVPIWSDCRAVAQAKRFFEKTDETQWYLTTGNGFPAHLYAVFKLMWYRDNLPALYEQAKAFIGTKDYINYRMTGVLCTDHSYASGSGCYSLTDECYVEEYIALSGIDREKFPAIFPSTHKVGSVLPQVARELGIAPSTLVICGGVDNACMAVGAGCVGEGEVYTSLGSSAWVAVSSRQPVVNAEKRPYVFAHCVPHHSVSATSIFAAGNSFRWVRDNLCKNLVDEENRGGPDSYKAMDALAEASPLGAKRLLFSPGLAGGSGMDKSPNVRGCFAGLDLGHTQADIIRATLEGVCMSLRLAMDVLESCTPLSGNMLIVGGGGKSRFWRTLFADIYNKNIIETNIGQNAGSLGAAAVAAVGAGLWQSFDRVREIHHVKETIEPDQARAAEYAKLLPIFAKVADLQSDIGDLLQGLQ